jgi:hypothetical protein
MSNVVVEPFVKEIHRVVTAQDLAGIANLVAEGAVLHTPRFLKPITDRAQMILVLQGIIKFVTGFDYYRIFTQGNEARMEFKGKVGDVLVHGLDIFTINDEGKIQELTVFIRPTKALEAIGQMEDEFFKRMAKKGD